MEDYRPGGGSSSSKRSKWCSGDWTKNPIAIRLVTMAVLTVSDLDVIFSFMFMYNLYVKGGIYLYFFALIMVGVVTYVIGAVYFAPRQKYRVFKQVKALMQSSPDEFESTKYRMVGTKLVERSDPGFSNGTPRLVTLQDPHRPPASGGARPKIFNELDPIADFKNFQLGLASWGCSAMWDRVEVKNSWNIAEVKHGLPFVRVARFGFQALPTPKDLSGILNANALYSFTTGFQQLAFGILLMIQFGVDAETLIPLSISGSSFVLSMANVLCDFAGKLNQIDCEARHASRILDSLNKEEQDQRASAKHDRDLESQKTEQAFKEKKDQASIVALAKARDEVAERYAVKLESIAKNARDLAKIEMRNYRRKLLHEKQLTSGSIDLGDEFGSSSLDHTLGVSKALQSKIDDVNKTMETKINDLDVAGLSSADVATQINNIRRDAEEKIRVFRAAIGPTDESAMPNEGVFQEIIIPTDPELHHSASGSDLYRRSSTASSLGSNMRDLTHADLQQLAPNIQTDKVEAMRSQFQGTWMVRPIDRDRWAVQSMIPISKDHVRGLLEWIDCNFQHCSGHVNGGTHGDVQGHHAANSPGGPARFGDVAFTTEDMQSICSVNNFWSIHTVTQHSPPIYPSVNFTVNAWCYSDALQRIQDGQGLRSNPPEARRLPGPARPPLLTVASSHSLPGPAQPPLQTVSSSNSLAHSPSYPAPMSSGARPMVVMASPSAMQASVHPQYGAHGQQPFMYSGMESTVYGQTDQTV